MANFVVKSPAKLNLYLNVVGRRKDGYHEIETIFERIDLTDQIKFSEIQNSEIELLCNNAEVPLGRDSLVYRTVELLKKELKYPLGIKITLNKSIPIASGLGGGSSNAAGIILGLNKFWGLNLTSEKLLNIGRSLGADVCFFLYDQPICAGFARGDKIIPLPGLKKPFWHVLVVPEQKISSSQAYSLYRPDLTSEGLTEPKFGIKMITHALKKGNLALLRNNLYNRLEQAVTEKYPVIEEVKQVLGAKGLKWTLMSGSGPAVFGLTKTGKEAIQLKKELDSEHQDWKTFVVKTY